MKTSKTILALLLAALLLMTAAQAQTVSFVGEECPIPMAAELGSFPENVLCAEISFLGRCPNGQLLVLVGDRLGYVNEADVNNVLEGEVDLSDLQSLSYLDPIDGSSTPEAAAYAQQLLIDVGTLEGAADGAFGKMSKNAASAFQAQVGLPETGKVDLMTQALLLKTLQRGETQEIVYPIVRTVEEKFKDIFGRTAWDLEAFMSPNWKFIYDGFEGTGVIEGKQVVASYLNDSSVLDRLEVTVDLIVTVSGGTEDEVLLAPAVRVTAEGSRAAYVKSVSLKSGSKVLKLENPVATRKVDGTTVCEVCVFELTEDDAAFMRASVGDDLGIRVTCANNTLDLKSEAASATAAFFEICQ